MLIISAESAYASEKKDGNKGTEFPKTFVVLGNK